LENPARLKGHKLRGLQDSLLRLLGNRVEARAEIVQRMLQRDANEAVSYWLQLCVSVGIATLGLVVGSCASRSPVQSKAGADEFQHRLRTAL
jgi:hypothetical protein